MNEATDPSVGILTYHVAVNNGAVLQAYALWKVLNDRGVSAEVIDYKPLPAMAHYTWFPGHNRKTAKIRHKLKQLLSKNGAYFGPDYLAWVTRYLKTTHFISQQRASSAKTFFSESELKEVSGKYKMVICGSDQIWDYSTSFRGFSSAFYLDWVDTRYTFKASYAASSGSVKTFGAQASKVKQFLSSFTNVGVRDQNTQILLGEECGISSELTLDPTYLISWDHMLGASPCGNYLFVTLENSVLPQKIEALIVRIAKERNLQIISVSPEHAFANVIANNLGPQEWITYIYHASFVVSDLFHGIIFSTKFEKPFMAVPRSHKMEKVGALLNSLGLEDRIYNPALQNQTPEHFRKWVGIDYSQAKRILELQVQSSQNYLGSLLKLVSDKNP